MQLRLADSVTLYTEDILRRGDGQGVTMNDAQAFCALENDCLAVRVRAGKTPVCQLRLRWQYKLEEKAPEARVYGDAWERGGGDLCFRGIDPYRAMPWFCLMADGTDLHGQRAGRRTRAFGVKVRPAAFCFWQADADGITLWLDVRCGGRGVILNGRTLLAAEVLMREYEDMTAFEAGEAFCAAMCSDPINPPYPVYGANNWYYAYGESSHEKFRRDGALLSELTRGIANRPFMVLDDGWTINPKNGPWDRGKAEFPDMPGLARELKDMNVRPGIWVRYFCNEGHVVDLPEKWHIESREDYLDPSREDVLEYVAAITRRFRDWGYELIKYDCNTQDVLGRRGYRVPYQIAEDGWAFADRGRTSAEIIVNSYRAIRAAAGDGLLMGCAVNTHLAAGLVHIARTGADVNGRNWDITRHNGVNALAFRMMAHGRFFASDADCVPITKDLRREDALKWLRLVAMSGTPLFVSCAPEFPDAAMKQELAAAYARGARQADRLVPLDWMENTLPEKWLLNGEEITFSWFDGETEALFRGGMK